MLAELDPVQRLSVAYAPAGSRAAFALLLALDSRLADVVLKATEPMIAQLKLAWWDDALSAEARPKGEPMLVELGQVEQSNGAQDVASAMRRIVEAWQFWAAQDDPNVEARRAFAERRADAIFGSYARWVGGNETAATDAGRRWTLADLAARTDRATLVLAEKRRLPRNLRPLSILLVAAEIELRRGAGAAGMRLVFHALTGR